jgi:tetratricopeptide (TPR) repeat protein
MTGLKNLINEAHRRSLWQVLGIYLVASWLAFQVVQTLTEGLGLPAWVPPFALVLLLIGLPVVLATAFVQETGPTQTTEAATQSTEAAAQSTQAAAQSTERAASAESTPSFGASTEQAGGAHHRLFTWRNAIIGGVAAFALLGVVTAGYMAMRTLGIGPAGTLVARGVIDERAPILLAEFKSGDSLLARAATEAFRVDLSQSLVVRLVEPGFVTDALTRMARPSTDRLDVELASELAVREGIQAVIAGEIVRAGGGYVLSARLIAPGDGAVLVSHRETASDSTQIIPAIDELSKRLRERIGESLVSIRANPPLEQVTTANLEALRKYSQAVEAIEVEGDPDRGIALLEEAVALDTAFAMAYRKLGVVLGNRGEERSRNVDALTRAFRHRDRLTEQERYMTVGTYYVLAEVDPAKAINAFENLLELRPDGAGVLNNLGVTYEAIRDYERADEFFSRAAASDERSFNRFTNWASVRVLRGDFEGAQQLLDTAAVHFPDVAAVDWWAARLAASQGRYDEARDRMQEAKRKEPASLQGQTVTARSMAAFEAIEGRMADAVAQYRELLAANEARDLGGAYLTGAASLALLEGFTRGRKEVAREELGAALERYPLETLDPLDRPYLPLARAYAMAGEPERARVLVAAFKGEVPEHLQKSLFGDEVGYAEGYVALADGDYDVAAARFRSMKVGLCAICGVAELALALDRAGQADSAIVAYERFVALPALFRAIDSDDAFLAPSLERLGQLYDERGDWEKAAEYYARFVELWKEADPELQPRVQAAQRRLNEIFAERG